jgi:tetratricopeptide (TPR) repeat protein
MEPVDPKTELTIAEFLRAIKKNPKDAYAYFNMGLWWHWKGQYGKALDHYNLAICHFPKFAYALSARASLRATCPDPTWRDGQAALEDAKLAIDYAAYISELDGSWKQRQYLQILAAAFAECGDFAQAIHWQNAALQLAITKSAAEEIRSRLAVFEAGRPLRLDEGLVKIGVQASGYTPEDSVDQGGLAK